MNKPIAYNYVKAEARIEELEEILQKVKDACSGMRKLKMYHTDNESEAMSGYCDGWCDGITTAWKLLPPEVK